MNILNFWRLMIRFGLLIGLAGLLLIALQPDLRVHAEEAAHPPLQDDYPPPAVTFDHGYPSVTDTPSADGPTATLESTPANTPVVPTGQSGTVLPTGQPTLETPTPDLSRTAESGPFQTENAEIGDSLTGTPQTPSPSGTPSPIATETPTPSGTFRTGTTEAEDEADGFEMNWGLFWIGFSIPVVGACGVVLYLLDRRPEFFRPKRK